ncbi:hypothetical protein [Superficieibacter sp. HKU1]|uniref:hypothetical protein n=1 Tax=Superficieibacter sp. HKU1 TaxID=3031919 RepID=UPI0023E351A2|nr:hypothetical protein [Superficieibacter sp. HKU1]WES67064.1 hypothetical protein P0H77_15635 [Superficieibacter sp. HKU1]
MKNESTFSDVSAQNLRALLDLMIWDMSHGGRQMIESWREELLSRSDAMSEDVQRAIAVCDEYLAQEGSPEAVDAAARAWPEE